MRGVLPALGSFLAVLPALLVPAGAWGQPAVAPKPLVMLLLDTSGSMEYINGAVAGETGDQNAPGVPSCLGPTYGKSRFITAQEVLTGSFDGYSCSLEFRNNPGVPPCPREDCPYPVPHVRASYLHQETDGLIDRSGSDFKFGVMTFDTKNSPSVAEPGAYSYGPEQGTNLGARNPSAPTGPFVKPSLSDADVDVLARNAAVQASILNAIPYGGTPIAPQLFDARYYFTSDPDMAADPYYYCRSKNVILITDGVANMGEGEPPYATAANEVTLLRAMGVHVYVIGFQLAPGVATLLQDLVGDPGPGAPAPERELHLANSTEDLVNAFRLILGAVPTPVQSRTRIRSTLETGNNLDAQYQFNAAYSNVIDDNGLRPGIRQGIIERYVYQCGADPDTPDEAGLQSIQRISDLLNAKPDAQRYLYTMAPGVTDPAEFRADNMAITNHLLDIHAHDAPLPDFSKKDTTDECRTGFLTGLPDAQVVQFRQNLFDWVRGTDNSCRRGFRTGPIVHSSPVVQGKLADVDIQVASFKAYRDRIKNRQVMMYVGTGDGVLHAFRVDRSDGTAEPDTWGDERWAYVPRTLLPELKDAPNSSRVLLDGNPVVKDVLFSRRAGQEEDEFSWHSVLVTGFRGGGRGYVALDVTDPTRPGEPSLVPSATPHFRVLWEISATEGRCLPGEAACRHMPGSFVDDFDRLGLTYSQPEIGNVVICPGGAASCEATQAEEVAVAIFGGGMDPGDGTGDSVFVVRLDNGEKLAEFRDFSPRNDVDSSCEWTMRRVRSSMVGNVACYSTFPGTFISRCFLGDKDGRLWRLDVGSPGIPNWQLQLYYDPYKTVNLPLGSPFRAPAYEEPGLALQANGNKLVTVYGGADADALDERVRKDFIVSLTEQVEPAGLFSVGTSCAPWYDLTCRIPYPTRGMQVGPNVNWKKFFGYDSALNLLPGVTAGERPMGPPVIFSNTAYFVTWKPDPTHVCSPGIGTLFGVDFVRKGSLCNQFQAKLPGPVTGTYVESLQLGDVDTGSIPYGLAVAPRPACYQGQNLSEAAPPSGIKNALPLSSLAAPVPKVVVQTGVRASAAQQEIPAQGATGGAIQQAVINVARAIQSLFVSSWGYIFD